MRGAGAFRAQVRVCVVSAFVALAALRATAGVCPGLSGGPGDLDGDGFSVTGGDCDDADPGLWHPSSEARNLRVPAGDRHRFRWDAPIELGGSSVSVTYEMVRTRVASNFLDHPTTTCLDPGDTTLDFTDPSIPPPGGVFFYVARARSACGPGSPGARSTGLERPIKDCPIGEVCDDGNTCSGDGASSDGICVHTPVLPKFVHAPASTAVCAGATARFFAEIDNEAGAHYAWTKNGVPVGTDSPVLVLPAVTVADNGAQIRVTATDTCAPSTSPPVSLQVYTDTASCEGGLGGQESPTGAGDPMRQKTYSTPNYRVPKGFPEARVLLHSGELELAATDLEILGRGFDVAWTRVYRSREWRSTSMGVGWTHAYDRHISPAIDGSGHIFVFGGDSRVDSFAPSTTGCYEAPGRFEELCPGSTAGMTLTFPDRTVWTFAPQDGSATQGKILQSRDAFGNTMTFAYDTAGRLTTITDTLGRDVTIAYNTRSLIDSVTDFTGRSVHYAYYDGIEPGGDLDDLKSVTSPPVAATPTGNDFPHGRTTTYTYTSGFQVGEMDHNLTSITDPLGHTFVRFAYSLADSTSDPAFDRLDRIETDDGSSTSVETYAYVAQIPDPISGPAVSKTIVKDGSGNVGEYFYDAQARLIGIRDYNGLAPDPQHFTGDVDNRPELTSPTDPPYFETTLSHNLDGLVTQIVYPEGDSIAHTYDSGNTSVLKRGDLTHETQYPGPNGGDQTQIDRSWSHASAFGTDWSGSGEARIVHPPGTPPGTWRRISDVHIVHPPGTPPGTWRRISDVHIVHPPATPPGTWRRISDVRIVHPPGTPPSAWNRRISDVRIVHPPGTPPGTARRISDVRIVHPPGTPPSAWNRRISDVHIVHPPGTPPGTWRVGGGLDRDDDGDDVPTIDEPLGAIANGQRDYVVQYQESDWDFVQRIVHPPGTPPGTWRRISDVHIVHPPGTPPGTNRAGGGIQARDACRNSILLGGDDRRISCVNDPDDDNDGVDTLDEDLRTLPAPRATTRIDSWAAIVESVAPGGDLPFAGSPTSYTDASGRTWSITYDAQGFLTDVEAPPVVTGTLSGAPQTIHHHWTRNAFGQVVSYTDPEGRTATVAYETAGPATGYAKTYTWTVQPTPIVDTYTFDAVGRLTQVTDPNGHATTMTITADDDVVRVTDPAPFSYQSDYYYDAAGRLTRSDVQNADATGALRPNHHLSAHYDYDNLGRVTRVSDEIDAPQCSIDEYAWNPESQLTRVLQGVPVAGGGSGAALETSLAYKQKLSTLLQFKTMSGITLSQLQLDYDGNGRLTALRQGSGGPLGPEPVGWQYDGFGRVTHVTDPEGNVTSFHFDPNGNAVSWRVDGELIDGSSGPNVRLDEASATFDEVNRLVHAEVQHFDRATGMPIGSGVSGTTAYYDATSRLTRTEDALGHGTDYAFDEAGRLHLVTDAPGNTTQRIYDAASNVLEVVETDAPGAGGPPASYTTHYEYDANGRPTAVVDPAGGRLEADYDSLGVTIALRDQLGNPTRIDCDGLGRTIRTERPLTDTGTGAGTVVATAVTTAAWDDMSNRLTFTDSEGNTSSWVHDGMGRATRLTSADGTMHQFVWDDRGNVTSVTDAAGTVRTMTYDGLDRLTDVSVARAPGVPGTTAEQWRYDGTGAVVSATDDDSTVTRSYDSLSNPLTQTQQKGTGPIYTVSISRDDAGNPTTLTYPSGHTLNYGYDALGRTQLVFADGAFVAAYEYQGPGRAARLSRGNGVVTQYDYDAAGRLASRAESGSALLFQDTLAWDLTGGLAVRARAPAAITHEYHRDSLHRLIQSTATGGGSPPTDVTYQLSPGGDRIDVVGGYDDGAYTRDSTLPEPADFQQHQYTATPSGTRTYDKNGNALTMAGGTTNEVVFTFDCAGQVVSAGSGGGGGGGGTVYSYDAFGDLIDSALNLSDDGLTSYRGRAIEQYTDGVLQAIFVHDGGGRLLQMIEQEDINGNGSLDTYWYHADEQGSVVAMTDAAGAVAESYTYDDHGSPHVFSSTGAPLPFSLIGNPYLYRGMRWDQATKLYRVGGSAYDPSTGREISAYGVAGEAFTLDATRSQDDGVRVRPRGDRFNGKYLICHATH